jgi:hypothetical protein
MAAKQEVTPKMEFLPVCPQTTPNAANGLKNYEDGHPVEQPD